MSEQQAPAQPVPLSVWRDPWHFLAFGLGSGTLPKAPGTWGSLIALPFLPLWQLLGGWSYPLLLVLLTVFGCWLCGKVARELGGESWRGLMRPVRDTAMELARQGEIEVLRKGKPVEPGEVRGVIRLRIAAR